MALIWKKIASGHKLLFLFVYSGHLTHVDMSIINFAIYIPGSRLE